MMKILLQKFRLDPKIFFCLYGKATDCVEVPVTYHGFSNTHLIFGRDLSAIQINGYTIDVPFFKEGDYVTCWIIGEFSQTTYESICRVVCNNYGKIGLRIVYFINHAADMECTFMEQREYFRKIDAEDLERLKVPYKGYEYLYDYVKA